MKDSELNVNPFPEFNPFVTSWWKQIRCVTIIPKYFNFAIFSKDLLAILKLRFYPASWWRDIKHVLGFLSVYLCKNIAFMSAERPVRREIAEVLLQAHVIIKTTTLLFHWTVTWPSVYGMKLYKQTTTHPSEVRPSLLRVAESVGAFLCR
jgi:hypothetical protein